MNPSTPPPQEPLNNVALESAILGLRMTLTPEESEEARRKFLEVLRDSPLAVPTVQPVPTDANGAVLPNAEINLLVVNTAEGVSGVPAFTTLGGLRAALPQVENGMFLRGAELGNILARSGHKLFVDGPDLHAEVEAAELQQMAQAAYEAQMALQQAAERNVPLEEALTTLNQTDNSANREQVVRAFLEGFCRYPVAGEGDQEAECLVLSQENPQAEPSQEISLLTTQGSLPGFTGPEVYSTSELGTRGAISLPGQMVVQLASQAEVPSVIINPGSPVTRTLLVQQGQLSLL